MKYVRQFLIILLISLLGELLHHWIPLPVPASVYGIVLMFLALEWKIVPLPAVREVSRFLVALLQLTFIPAGVGLMTKWEILRPVAVPVLAVLFIVTFLVLFVAGRVTQALLRRGAGKEAEDG
ncbi:MAG: CidA/LrgA family protein [Oscillospiraceae bacterium]|nr:CidA/LrgA family protein [Oscillospiraceae bacterium]